jgi:hypothetical protein
MRSNDRPGLYDSTDIAELTGNLDDAIDAATSGDEDETVYAETRTDTAVLLSVLIWPTNSHTIDSFDRQDWKDGGSGFLKQLFDQDRPNDFRCLVRSAREGGAGIADFWFETSGGQ